MVSVLEENDELKQSVDHWKNTSKKLELKLNGMTNVNKSLQVKYLGFRKKCNVLKQQLRDMEKENMLKIRQLEKALEQEKVSMKMEHLRKEELDALMKKALETMEEVRKEQESRRRCTICCDRKKNAVLLPCAHRLCEACATKLQKCPFCQRRKLKVL